MPLFAPTPNSSAPRAKIPPGSHFGVLYSIIDLGTHEEVFQGEAKIQRKVRLTWELPDERAEFDGADKPLVIGLEFTLSLHEKAKLRKYVEGMLGKTLDEDTARKFDLETLLGNCSLLNVVDYKRLDGAVGVKVNGASALMKGMKPRPPENKKVLYSVMDGRSEVFEALPAWLKEKIEGCKEWAKGAPEPKNDAAQDDIPF